MIINSFLIGAIIAIVIATVFALTGTCRGKGNRDKHGELEKLRSNGHYWGVKIQPGQCSVIRPFAGRRFSFDEAPVLPLPGCTAKRCLCRYIGVTERRGDERRTQMDRRRVFRIEDEHADRRSLQGRRRNKKRIDPSG
jgi:hypothetical protein